MFRKSFTQILESDLKCKCIKKLSIPESIHDIPHLLIYGPYNSNKYLTALSIIRQYSPSQLKSQKKIELEISKCQTIFQCSDVHYEIDFGLLGTSFKTIWSEFLKHILTITNLKGNKTSFILIHNFHDIPDDMLEYFYANINMIRSNITVKFILITRHISFIPDNIFNYFQLVRCQNSKNTKTTTKMNMMKTTNNSSTTIHSSLNNKIYIDTVEKKLSEQLHSSLFIEDRSIYQVLRDKIYQVFTKKMNTHNVLTYLVFEMMKNDEIKDIDGFFNTFFYNMKLYNNNYRPIYHFESIILNMRDNII